jgi:arylsulfatase A-like enzyme
MMNQCKRWKCVFLGLFLGLFLILWGRPLQAAQVSGKPNILWIIVEDMSCDFGYQGQDLVGTPHVDRLAQEGAVFTNAYVTAPVCSASRSALITGMYQTSIGAHHHRSSRGKLKHALPSHVKLIPTFFRAAGYYTCNGGFSGNRPDRTTQGGKTDYNFVYDNKSLYQARDWSQRKPGQPFFAQIHLRGGKLRNVPKWYEEVEAGLAKLVTADQVSLPPYYPKDPVFERDWAEYLNSVQYTDKEVGFILKRLQQEDLLRNTIIFFITDHGISQARGKQFLYDEGAKIPFIIWAPKHIKPGTLRREMTAHIDVAATSLYFAGIDIPDAMQARPLFGPQAQPREYVVVARDRCDETVDRIRSVRQGTFKYIRNFYPQRPYLQPCAYKDQNPFMEALRQLHAENRLDPSQLLHMAQTRPEEELYDLSRDPWEVHSLAGNPEYQDTLRAMRSILADWEIETDDRGRFPEPASMYDSDMKVYVDQMKKKKPDHAARIEANIRQMKLWAEQGK